MCLGDLKANLDSEQSNHCFEHFTFNYISPTMEVQESRELIFICRISLRSYLILYQAITNCVLLATMVAECGLKSRLNFTFDLIKRCYPIQHILFQPYFYPISEASAGFFSNLLLHLFSQIIKKRNIFLALRNPFEMIWSCKTNFSNDSILILMNLCCQFSLVIITLRTIN